MNIRKPSKHIPPSVIFLSMNYRYYISCASKLNNLNIQSVERFEMLDNCNEHLLSRGLSLSRELNSFHELCSELMNVNCEHGFYRPSAVDIRRLLSWQETTRYLQSRISHKLCTGEYCHG